jgi:hypothetical protein
MFRVDSVKKPQGSRRKIIAAIPPCCHDSTQRPPRSKRFFRGAGGEEEPMWQQIETVLTESFAVRIVAATVVVELAVASIVVIVRELASLLVA